MDYEMVLNRL